MEEYVLSTEIEVPVYFAEESEDLDYLVESLQGLGNEKSASAAQGNIFTLIVCCAAQLVLMMKSSISVGIDFS